MKVTNEQTAYDGHFKIKTFDVTDPTTNHTHKEECFERGDSVAALVLDREKQTFLFTKQFRIGAKQELLEVVAGSMDKEGEEPIDALKRELMEELGVEIAPSEDGTDYPNYQSLGVFYPSPGGCSEKIHLFVVDKIVRSGKGGGVNDEEIIDIVELTVEQLEEKFQENAFIDLKTAFLLQAFLAAQQPHL